MQQKESLKWTFNAVADAYAAARPGYVEDVFLRILEYCPLGENSRALEIGIGAGAATEPFLRTGCALTAVEYGDRFCMLCRDKFRAWPRFDIINDSFENAVLPENSYDLVYSASAFHWIGEEAGCQKVYALLKEGGTFARFTIRVSEDPDDPHLSGRIRQIYEKYHCMAYGTMPAPPEIFDRQKAEAAAACAERYGFTDSRVYLFNRVRNLTGEEYMALIGTYSDNVAMKEEIRRAFFSEVRSVLRQHGDRINLYDVIDLELARKPAGAVHTGGKPDEESP